jgi:hypothetical protein
MTQATLKPAPGDPAKKARLVVWILLGLIVAAGVIWYASFSASKPVPPTPRPQTPQPRNTATGSCQ